MVDLVAGISANILGLTGSYLTDTTMPIGGVGGQIDAAVSQPIGYFAAGLGAINSNGTLDLSKVKGHSNTCIIAAPEIACDTGESISGVIGTPFVSFFTTVMKMTFPRRSIERQHYSTQMSKSCLPTVPPFPSTLAESQWS
jgi:hypothetical protein